MSLVLALVCVGLLFFYVNKRLKDTNISAEDRKNYEKVDNPEEM